MRDLIFRGKRKSDGDWVYGDHAQGLVEGDDHVISYRDDEDYCYDDVVDGQTIGQYIGEEDSNQRPIYEDDVLKYDLPHDTDTYRVVWDPTYCGFILKQRLQVVLVGYITKFELRDVFCHTVKLEDMVVVGNIHDNPELWENERPEPSMTTAHIEAEVTRRMEAGHCPPEGHKVCDGKGHISWTTGDGDTLLHEFCEKCWRDYLIAGASKHDR